jgi:hypothetical protein
MDRFFIVVAVLGSQLAHANSLSVSTTQPIGCKDVTATLNLTNPAPAGGSTFTTSTSPSGLLVAPPTVSVAEGATSASFIVSTVQVSADTPVTLTLTGASTVSRVLTLNPNSPRSITGPTRLGPLSTSTGSVTLECAAPPGGLSVVMASSDPSVLQVPGTLAFDEGSVSATYSITTADVASQTTVSVTASRGDVTRPTSVIVKPPTIRTFSFSSTVPIGGDPVEGIVTMDFAAGSAGVEGTFSSANAAVAGPASGTFTVAPGETQGRFSITTVPVVDDTPVVFTATANGLSRTATLTVRKNRVETVALSHTVVSACRPISGRVRLRSAAGVGGTDVALAVDRTDIVALSATTVTVPQGSREATFTISFVGPVSPAEVAVLTAQIAGQASPTIKTVNLDVVRTSAVGCD